VKKQKRGELRCFDGFVGRLIRTTPRDFYVRFCFAIGLIQSEIGPAVYRCCEATSARKLTRPLKQYDKHESRIAERNTSPQERKKLSVLIVLA
jgi:hypothetical protein